MLDEVKIFLRIAPNTNAFDVEVQGLIDFALLDLTTTGVDTKEKVVEEVKVIDDAMIVMAVKLYSKANFGYDVPDYDRLMHSYNLLKAKLSLTSEYGL